LSEIKLVITASNWRTKLWRSHASFFVQSGGFRNFNLPAGVRHTNGVVKFHPDT